MSAEEGNFKNVARCVLIYEHNYYSFVHSLQLYVIIVFVYNQVML